jgi:hypothetical protein
VICLANEIASRNSIQLIEVSSHLIRVPLVHVLLTKQSRDLQLVVQSGKKPSARISIREGQNGSISNVLLQNIGYRAIRIYSCEISSESYRRAEDQHLLARSLLQNCQNSCDDYQEKRDDVCRQIAVGKKYHNKVQGQEG